MTVSGPGRKTPSSRPGRRRSTPIADSAAAPSAARAWPWFALALAALPVLLWVTRGAPLGTPVADDYDFLYWLRFHRPLSFFDAMGGGPYWRPVTRQLYVTLLAPAMFRAPWLVAAVHVAALAVLVVALFLAMRRAFPPPVAAAIAAFAPLARPARTLLAWPSGIEPLAAMTFVALALHAALSRRRFLASAFVLAAALSYEQSLLVAPLLVMLVLARAELERDHVRAWIAPALVGSALFGLGHLLAARHGAGVLGGAWVPGERIAAWHSLGPAIAVLLDVEDLAPRATLAVWVAYGAVLAAALVLARRPARRARLERVTPVVLAGAAWFVAGMIVASFGSTGWYPWRVMLPGMGLGVAIVGALGAIEPWLVGAFVAVRLVALLLAPPVPHGVEGMQPPASSRHAFIRVARLQRVVDDARRALLTRFTTLPRGAAVRYWALPEMTAWGFDSGKAPQVWYGDSTLTFDWLADPTDRADAVLAFNPDSARPAVVIEPASLAAYADARRALAAGDPRTADARFANAVRAQSAPASAYRFSLANEQARVALQLGDVARADSLNQLAWALAGETPPFLRMAARLALARGRPDVAAAAAKRCLTIAASDTEAAGLLARASAPAPDARSAR